MNAIIMTTTVLWQVVPLRLILHASLQITVMQQYVAAATEMEHMSIALTHCCVQCLGERASDLRVNLFGEEALPTAGMAAEEERGDGTRRFWDQGFSGLSRFYLLSLPLVF